MQAMIIQQVPEIIDVGGSMWCVVQESFTCIKIQGPCLFARQNTASFASATKAQEVILEWLVPCVFVFQTNISTSAVRIKILPIEIVSRLEMAD